MSTFMMASEVAEVLGCTPANVRALERAGRLRAERTKTGVRIFRVEDVERLAAEREQQKANASAGTKP